ncbi:twin-arginine translocase subunit TatC [Paenibacillus sp. 1P07SE]|uniref:twin-arginine translocase subunit TatC n=1 Tax=Paenibacillus sp. 1P07SE TaxID=3132209 RepID=UPI0039A52C2A
MAEENKKASSGKGREETFAERIGQEGLMPLLGHVGELRKRIIAVLVVLLLGLMAGLSLAKPVYDFLMSQEPAVHLTVHSFSLWDGVGIYMKFALIMALLVTLPFTFYQLWSFVKPALAPSEQRATLRYIPLALIMLLLGLSFSYFVVFPMAYYFTTAITRSLDLVETFGAIQYLQFMFNIIIPISLLFELPILIMFLTKLRILNPVRLRKMRRVAYFVLITISALITPPDVVSAILVAIPLIILYEFSVFLSGRVYRKQLEKDAEIEARYANSEA